MRRIAAFLLLLSSTSVSFGQPPSSATSDNAAVRSLDPQLHDAIVRLGGQLLLSDKAYQYDRVLADDIGPRLTGSANYNKAVDWALNEFQRMGLSNVHREGWEIAAAWEPATWATGRILLPHEQRLHLESDGWSPSTPPGGVRGQVYYLPALDEESVKSHARQVKDAIVLIDRASLGDSKQFDKQLDAIALLASEGARALLLGIGAADNVASMFGLTCCTGSLASLPIGNVGSEDSLLLKRLLDHGPVEVEFTFVNRIREHINVDNVVAEIPGTDASGEYILVGGHLDSWQLGTGAEDNGTGAATVMAVAEALQASGLHPRRTIRFVLFGGEEEGLLGSIRYVRAHAAELDRCTGVFITDSGPEPPKGWVVFGRRDEADALRPLDPLLASLDAAATSESGRFTFATDHAPFLVRGVPSFMLWTGSDKYRQLHHKPSDTFDKVDPRDLNLGAAVVGMTAFAWADSDQVLPHLTSDQVDEQLKKIDAREEYRDMQAHHEF